MDDQRHATALTDQALERDIARALAVDPSPEFLARVRTCIASEPTPSGWQWSWALCFAGAPLLAAVIVYAAVLMRADGAQVPSGSGVLASRAIPGAVSTLPDVESGLTRFPVARGSTSSPRAAVQVARPELAAARGSTASPRAAAQVARPDLTAARGSTASPRAAAQVARPELVEGRASRVEPSALLDPRETQALRALIAGVRDNRVDLTPLLQPGVPAPMELPLVDDLVIAPIAIEPLAPQSGAQGERP